MKLVRVIDTKRCIGCRACVAACMVENFYNPGDPWNFVVEYEQGEFPNVRRVFVPMNCMHCENPPCQKACDYVGAHAIYKNEFGVVLIDYDKCIGCRYCIAVCPYGAPQYVEKLEPLFPNESFTPYERIPEENRHEVHRFRPNIVTKCTFCWHRIEKAIKENKEHLIGVHPEYTPACDLVCPVDARFFGDIENPDSKVAKIVGEKKAAQLKKEFGTRPQVYYILEGGDY